MLRILSALAASFLATTASFAEEARLPEPQTPQAWRAAALADVAMIEKTLRENTPFGVDGEPGDAARWLATGFAEAKARAETVENKAGWYYTLNAYVNGFRDPHVNLQARTSLPAARWPGFIAVRRQGRVEVGHREGADAPPLGAVIESCDGAPIETLLRDKIYPFALNDLVAMDRRRAPTRLFLDRQVPFAAAPQACVFRVGDASETRTLSWRPLPTPDDGYWSAYNALTQGPSAVWGASEAAPGVHWIGVPTFASGGESGAKLQALVDDVRAKAAAMRSGRAIVIDVRGNGGGNTAWSNRLIEALIPAQTLRRHAPPPSVTAVDWRPSPDNIAYFREFLIEAKAEFGETSEEAHFLAAVSGNLEKARSEGHPFWREGPIVTGQSGGLTTKRPRARASLFPARIYILSNGSCASTCLNFLDRMLFIPGVRLIGAASGGDTDMMEVRSVDTASGLARLTLPQKAYRGRGRASMEAYAPDDPYDGPWDEAAVRAWAIALATAR